MQNCLIIPVEHVFVQEICVSRQFVGIMAAVVRLMLMRRISSVFVIDQWNQPEMRLSVVSLLYVGATWICMTRVWRTIVNTIRLTR